MRRGMMSLFSHKKDEVGKETQRASTSKSSSSEDKSNPPERCVKQDVKAQIEKQEVVEERERRTGSEMGECTKSTKAISLGATAKSKCVIDNKDTEKIEEAPNSEDSRERRTSQSPEFSKSGDSKKIGQSESAAEVGNLESMGQFAEEGTDGSGIPQDSNVTRVYKKCASNGSIAIYVGTRTLNIEKTHLEPLKGVVVIDKNALGESVSPNFRIFGQITLVFRYGREDEEVLGLRFCNEAILALKQLWPPLEDEPDDEAEELTPLQSVLLERVRTSANSDSIQAFPFVLQGGPVGLGAFPPPPSVLLFPAKPYKGQAIGTIYDLRIYASERPEEKPSRRSLIRLALRVVQIPCNLVKFERFSSLEARPTFLSRGKIHLRCEIDKNSVRYGESLEIKLVVQNNSRSSIRRVMISLIQQVDVCMFTSGKFKNTVGFADDQVLIVPGASIQKTYTLQALRGPAKQWLALEEAFGRPSVLAPTTSIRSMEGDCEFSMPVTNAMLNPQSGNSRNVFAIIVSYYVKAKLILGGLGGLSLCQSLKIPFALLPPAPEISDPDPYPEINIKTGEENEVSAQATCSTTNKTEDEDSCRR